MQSPAIDIILKLAVCAELNNQQSAYNEIHVRFFNDLLSGKRWHNIISLNSILIQLL